MVLGSTIDRPHCSNVSDPDTRHKHIQLEQNKTKIKQTLILESEVVCIDLNLFKNAQS
jgi:hypothetical protein